jgi:hypothetical protein
MTDDIFNSILRYLISASVIFLDRHGGYLTSYTACHFYVLISKPGAFTAFRYMLLNFRFTTTVRYISTIEVFWTLS